MDKSIANPSFEAFALGARFEKLCVLLEQLLDTDDRGHHILAAMGIDLALAGEKAAHALEVAIDKAPVLRPVTASGVDLLSLENQIIDLECQFERIRVQVRAACESLPSDPRAADTLATLACELAGQGKTAATDLYGKLESARKAAQGRAAELSEQAARSAQTNA